MAEAEFLRATALTRATQLYTDMRQRGDTMLGDLAATAALLPTALALSGLTLHSGDLATVPTDPGVYRLTTTGQVWEREADGELVRRQDLELLNAQAATSLASLPKPPHPLYIESKASFGDGIWYPNDVTFDAAREWSFYVTAEGGATQLASLGGDPVAEVGSAHPWLGTIEHDDGTRAQYTVLGYAGNTITITPPLQAGVTNAALSNVHWHGNHYTPSGYKALGHHVYKAIRRYAARELVAAQFLPTDLDGPWQLLGGLTTGGLLADGATPKGLYYDIGLNAHVNGLVSAVSNKSATLGIGVAGQGAGWSVGLQGVRGYVEAFIGTRKGTCTVQLVLDGTVQHSVSVNRRVQRITFPYNGARAGELRIIADASTPTYVQIGRVSWWIESGLTGNRAWPGVARTVLYGDSWTQYHGRAWQTEMERLIRLDGMEPQIINSGKSGMTSEWGRAWYRQKVLDLKPDYVILEFSTNDINYGDVALGAAPVVDQDPGPDGGPLQLNVSQARWLENLNWMVDQAMAHGIVPIVVMPAPSADEGQCILRGQWSEALANGGRLTPSQLGAVSAEALTTDLLQGGGGTGAGDPLIIRTAQPNSGVRDGLRVVAAGAVTGGNLATYGVEGESAARAAIRHDGALHGHSLELTVWNKDALTGAAPGYPNRVFIVSNPAAGKGRLIYSDGAAWRYVSDDSLV